MNPSFNGTSQKCPACLLAFKTPPAPWLNQEHHRPAPAGPGSLLCFPCSFPTFLSSSLGTRRAVAGPRAAITAQSLPVPAAAGPWLKPERRPAVQRFVGCNRLNAWLGRLVPLNGTTSAAFPSHPKQSSAGVESSAWRLAGCGEYPVQLSPSCPEHPEPGPAPSRCRQPGSCS